MTTKFNVQPYEGERFSPGQWFEECFSKYGFEVGLQVRKLVGDQIVSSQKIYFGKKDKWNQAALMEMDPNEKISLYFDNKSKEKITKTQFFKIANDGNTILPHWIVIDHDFDHKSINFEDKTNHLFNVLKQLDEIGLKYFVIATEEGRGIKIVIPFKDLLILSNLELEKTKKQIGEYIKNLIGGELKLTGDQCSPCYPAREGEEPIHAKTGKPLKIIHFTGMNNSLKEVLEKIPKEEMFRYRCLSCGNKLLMEKIDKKNKCFCGGKFKLIKESPQFNFPIKKSSQPIKSLDQLKEIIIKNFPSIWFETKACLSACAALSLKNLNGCPSLNLVGNPAGEKTTVLSFFYGQDKIYISDDFTPRAFVSHSANVGKEELEDIDLLPRIKDSILITPELAPLFEAPKDRLVDNFATLTRVLDGEGLNRDSGVHGHRGYSGDYKFVWLGATTPLRSSVWNIMGKIGNRLFFLSMKDKNRTDNDYLSMFRGQAYEEKVQECRGAVRGFLDNLFERNGIRKLEWDAEGDILLLPEIIKYAKFLSKLRASLMTWRGEERGEYEYSFPIIEEPPRAINALYNLAKGHALINGRNFLKIEDIEIVKAVCFSSMPYDRHKFLQLLAKHEGKLTTQQIEKELGCSTQTATRTMKTFEILGIVTIKNIQIDYSGTGRPMNYIEINSEFMELLKYTQCMNDGINPKFQENSSVDVDYENLNPEDFVKRKGKSIDTRDRNNGKNDLFQKNKPVSNIDFSQSKIEEALKDG